MTYRIHLLGGASLEGPSGPLSGRIIQRRQLAVLSILARTPGPLTREKAVGLLWPDTPEEKGRHLLTDTLYVIRRSLGEAAVMAEADTLRLNRDLVESDATAFEEAVDAEAWQEAVRLYGGPFLDGFHVEGAAEFERWIEGQRLHLAERYRESLERLAEAAESRGARDEAVRWWKQRAADEPTNSRVTVRLMDALGAAGNVPGALEHARIHELLLEEELEVPLPREVRDARERLAERGASEPSPPPTAARPVAASVPATRQAIPLVGRAGEMAALEERWGRVVEGPRVMVVAGEAGVGKTRLAEELAARVTQDGGVAVARARCFASRGRLALSPVAEWLRSPALREGIEGLDAAWRLEVGRLVPELGTGDGQAPPAPLADAWQRRQFFEGLARAALAGDHPKLLVLDDLQWCDPETLAWLEVLVHLQPDARLLVLGTLRSEELDDNAELMAFHQTLRAAGKLEELEVAPLDARETGELAEALDGRRPDEEASRRLLADTGGFPLFLVESLRGDSPRASRTEAVLAGRFARLSPAAWELAGLAAAVGRDFSMELLAAAGDLRTEEALLSAVDELWRRWLLKEHSPKTYDFAHDLLRDAAYGRLTPPQRRRHHRRIAAALEELHAGDPGSVAAAVADQYERGGRSDRAVHYHRLAGGTATTVFAHDAAVGHHERALELLHELPAGEDRDRQELDLLEDLVPSLVALRSYADPEVGRALERMAALGRKVGDEATELRGRSALSAHLFVQGRVREGAALIEDVIERAGKGPDSTGEHSVARVWSLTSLGRPQEALEHSGLLEQRTGSTAMSALGFPVRVMALGWRAKALWLAGRADEAEESAAASLELADELEEPFGQALAKGYGGITQCLLGDVERTGQLAASLQELCRRYGFAYYGEWGRILEGWAAGGNAGERLIREGLDELRRQHAGRAWPFWLALLAETLTRDGRAGEASRVLSEARTWAEGQGDRWWLAELWRLDAALHPEARAESMLERALTVARGQGALALELRAATDLARRWFVTGRVRAATGLLGPVRARADACNPADVAVADALVGGDGVRDLAHEGSLGG